MGPLSHQNKRANTARGEATLSKTGLRGGNIRFVVTSPVNTEKDNHVLTQGGFRNSGKAMIGHRPKKKLFQVGDFLCPEAQRKKLRVEKKHHRGIKKTPTRRKKKKNHGGAGIIA